jgi:hypothetical protein
MRDPLDLCFQPAFAFTPDVATDDDGDVRRRSSTATADW